MKSLHFSLTPVAPFRLDLTATALKRRPSNQIDAWDGESYSRVLAQNGRSVLIEVRQTGTSDAPHVSVTATVEKGPPINKSDLKAALGKLLGLQLDLSAFYRFARSDSQLAPLVQRYMGLKPPRFPSVFEAIINGIACQQLTLHVGLILLGRLSEKAGLPIETSSGTRYSFPAAERLRAFPNRTFRALGFSTNKAIAIKSISNDIHTQAFDPESLSSCENEEAISRLLALRGVGRWTAEYVLLRGLGRTDLFPGDDVGARNNLKRWLNLNTKLDYAGVNKTVARWRPFAGLLYFHLLLDSLEASGQFTPAQAHREAA